MKYLIVLTLLPLSFAFAVQNGVERKYEARQAHDDLVRSGACKVTMYEDELHPGKTVAVVQEQVETDDRLEHKALKDQLLKLKQLPKNGEKVAFNIDCLKQ